MRVAGGHREDWRIDRGDVIRVSDVGDSVVVVVECAEAGRRSERDDGVRAHRNRRNANEWLWGRRDGLAYARAGAGAVAIAVRTIVQARETSHVLQTRTSHGRGGAVAGKALIRDDLIVDGIREATVEAER